jgi:hypothetical protein
LLQQFLARDPAVSKADLFRARNLQALAQDDGLDEIGCAEHVFRRSRVEPGNPAAELAFGTDARERPEEPPPRQRSLGVASLFTYYALESSPQQHLGLGRVRPTPRPLPGEPATAR